MYRHRGVTFQPQALRPTMKQTDGGRVRVVGTGNRRITLSRTTVPGQPEARKGKVEPVAYVFVVDTAKRPLTPIHPGEARRHHTAGTAAVWCRFPFTRIRKAARPHARVEPLRLQFDPGAHTPGVALVNEATGHVVLAAEIPHRGQHIRDRVTARRATRRSRRHRHTRYRPARFDNRRRPAGGLPPSLMSRVQTMLTWTARLRTRCPITAVRMEVVRFDTQLMHHAQISGGEYQQGELAGYEVREYGLEQGERKCAYCGATNVPVQMEHIVARTRGGSNRRSHRPLACEPGKNAKNAKGVKTAAEFGHPAVQGRALQPLHDAAAVNATRWLLVERLHATGLPVDTGSGGRTKWNRTQRALPKAHWLDAACVRESTPTPLTVASTRPLQSTAMGREARHMCRMDRLGVPAHLGERVPRRSRFSDGRHRASGRHYWQHGRHLCWSCRCTSYRLVQRDHSARHGTVRYRASRTDTVTLCIGQMATLTHSRCKGGGASSPCLTAGVSAPIL
jgi:RRXRR protein